MKRHSTHWNETAANEARTVGRWFTRARREGLLAALPPPEWQTLSAVLSFTGRDGRRHFTLEQLALALGTPRDDAEGRLRALAARRWRDALLLRLETDSTGEIAGAALGALEVLLRVETAEGETEPNGEDPGGTDPERASDPQRAPLAGALAGTGLNPPQIERLLASYPAERIERQLRWLPARGARNPAAMLVRAIEEDWEQPKGAA